jgi:hypothetical protein
MPTPPVEHLPERSFVGLCRTDYPLCLADDPHYGQFLPEQEQEEP